jgi:hypothetical protein
MQKGVLACLAAPVAGAVRGNAVSRAPLNILIFMYRTGCTIKIRILITDLLSDRKLHYFYADHLKTR